MSETACNATLEGRDGLHGSCDRSGGLRRLLLLTVLLLAGTPLKAQEIELPAGEEIETRLEADFNGDGFPDLAYLAGNEDVRSLTVMLSVPGDVHLEFQSEVLPLEPVSLGSGALSFERNVLTFVDLTAGTTAYASTRRYRFDAQAARMRLIGLDATLYSRTYAHDGFETSWNLLTGDLITREMHLNQGGGDAAYDPIVERKSKRRVPPVWLSETPDPEELISELSGD